MARREFVYVWLTEPGENTTTMYVPAPFDVFSIDVAVVFATREYCPPTSFHICTCASPLAATFNE